MWRTGRKFAGGVLVGAVAVLALAAPASASAATISIDDPSATEGDVGASSANFTVSLSEASSQTVTVDFATSDATALGLLDYTPHSETVSFAPGETSKQVAVQVNGDLIDEPDETLTGNLSNPSASASVAGSQGTATILDDDGVPGISIDDATTTEGDSGEKDLTFAVSLSNPSALPVTVDYATADDTATIADDDYESASGTVTFAAGDTSETVTVDVNGDAKDESDESFDVNLSSPSANSSIADATGAGTITNDDDPAISIDDVSSTEGDTGEKDFDFTVSLSNPSDQQITVNYATANGTATTGDGDYDSATGTLTFAAGDTSETATVKVNGDNKDESDETFDVKLSSPSSNSSIADASGAGTIQDDDGDPGVSIDDYSEIEGNSGGKDFVFTVSLSHPSSASVSVDYATADGSATAADNDYDPESGEVTFAPGDVSETVTVTVNGDAADEAHESFLVNLTDAPSSNDIVADGEGVGTIQNDDAAPTAGACPPAASDPQEGSVGALGHFRIAQTFTSQITGVAMSAHAKIEKRAGAGGDWVLSVVSTDASGAPTDDVLGSVAVSDSTVPAGVSTIGGILDEPVELTAGERYAFVLTRPGAAEVRARIRVGDVCRGEIFRSLDQTGPFAAISSFSSIPPGLDIVFAVCGSTGPCFPPAEPASAPGPQPPPAPELELQPGVTVTLDADRSKIRQGKRVTLSGRVGAAGDPSCASGQTVSLQRRRPREAAFTTFAQVQSDPQGSFSLRQKPKKTSEYRAEVIATAACAAGLSDTELVKVRKRK
jgi:hypothetical protein